MKDEFIAYNNHDLCPLISFLVHFKEFLSRCVTYVFMLNYSLMVVALKKNCKKSEN